MSTLKRLLTEVHILPESRLGPLTRGPHSSYDTIMGSLIVQEQQVLWIKHVLKNHYFTPSSSLKDISPSYAR